MNLRSKIKVIKKGMQRHAVKPGIGKDKPKPEARRIEMAETVLNWVKEFRDRKRADGPARERFHSMFAPQES